MEWLSIMSAVQGNTVNSAPASMVARRVGTNSTISVFFCPLPPLPLYKIDLSQDIGSVTWHWGTTRPTHVLSSKSNIVPGGGGYRFHLWGDLLRRLLKE